MWNFGSSVVEHNYWFPHNRIRQTDCFVIYLTKSLKSVFLKTDNFSWWQSVFCSSFEYCGPIYLGRLRQPVASKPIGETFGFQHMLFDIAGVVWDSSDARVQTLSVNLELLLLLYCLLIGFRRLANPSNSNSICRKNRYAADVFYRAPFNSASLLITGVFNIYARGGGHTESNPIVE
jgi:hypothetical protein